LVVVDLAAKAIADTQLGLVEPHLKPTARSSTASGSATATLSWLARQMIKRFGVHSAKAFVCVGTTMPGPRAERTDGPGTSWIDRLWNAGPMVGDAGDA